MIGLQPYVIGAGIYESRRQRPGETESPPRVLQTYELGLYRESSGTAWINGQECRLRKDLLVLGRPGDLRRNKLHFTCYSIHFRAEAAQMVQMLEALPHFMEDQSHLEERFLEIIRLKQNRERFSSVAVSALLGRLLWEVWQQFGDQESALKPDPVRQALRLIQQEYQEPHTVETLAQLCNMSVSYFHKLFLQSTGTSPNHYLMLTRLSAAKAMLLGSRLSVAEIARRCGFSSQGYFCDCMKKYIGYSPTRYRQLGEDPE